MLADFQKFLLKTNALALAIGVIIGGAVGKVVSSLVSDILMPLLGLALPGGDWREAKLILSKKIDGSPGGALTYGAFIGSVVDFVIIAFAIYMITKHLMREAPVPAPPPTKACRECTVSIPAAAKRCKFCTSPA